MAKTTDDAGFSAAEVLPGVGVVIEDEDVDTGSGVEDDFGKVLRALVVEDARKVVPPKVFL